MSVEDTAIGLRSEDMHAFAQMLRTAYDARDPAAMVALYSSDAVIWHINDDLALTLERHLTTFIQNTSAIDSFSYKDVKVHPFVGGFVQQHRTQGKMKSGQEFEVHACIVCVVDNGKLTRFDEYWDTY